MCAFMLGRSKELNVLAHGREIVVTEPKHDFCAVYVKSVNSPLLVLKLRAPTTDVELMIRAWEAANDKARELGWIE